MSWFFGLLGSTGQVIDPEDTENFAATLSGLLAHPADCARLGAAAHERCRKMFDWRLIADSWQLCWRASLTRETNLLGSEPNSQLRGCAQCVSLDWMGDRRFRREIHQSACAY
jgi:hypothetical protein